MHKQLAQFAAANRVQRRMAIAATVAILSALSACTPSLNWRELSMGKLKVNLPCKPDRAQRPVVMGPTTLLLDMAGCEADGALFAVSHASVPTGANAQDVMNAWQSATLENMQAQQAVDLRAYQAASASKSALTIAQVEPLKAKGKNPQGEAVQGRFVWFMTGGEIYHLAVYAADVRSDMAEPLFTQARIQ